MMVFSEVVRGRVDSGTGAREAAAAAFALAFSRSPRAKISLHLRVRRTRSAGVVALWAACMYRSAAAIACCRASAP
jgi:hypothetical protein